MFNSIREAPTTKRHLSPNPTLDALGKKRHFKQVRNYYILAALAGLSILSILYYDFQHKDDIQALQETQRQWSNQHADASKLLNLAAGVYDSGYEKLKSRGSAPVAEKMRPTAVVFYAGLTALQEKLHLESAQIFDLQLLPRLESIKASMHELEITIEKIDARFRPYQSGIDFGELINLKDKYQEVRVGLYQLNDNIWLIQHDLLSEKYKAGDSLLLIKLLLKLMIFLMIMGSIYFGFRIVRQANLDAHAARQHAEEFAALYDTSIALSLQQDLPSLLKAITQQVKMLFTGCDAVVLLFDEKRGDLEVKVSDWIPLGTRLRLGEGISGTVAQTREPLIVNDYKAWTHPALQNPKLAVKAFVAVPMLYRGQLLGVLGVDTANASFRKFTDADARFLSLFAGQAASAVHNTALLSRIQGSEERFRIVAECTSNLIYDWDLVNDCVEYFGVFPKEARARGIHLPQTQQEQNDSICSDDRDRVLAARESHFITGTPFAEEYRITSTDGTQKYLADRAQVIRDIDGRPIKLIGSTNDISERKRTEHMKSDFVSFVTHQLRTPLTGVKWMLELAIEELENPEGVQAYIQDARNSTERLITLVNNMLDIARLERGGMPVARSEVDLPELTKSVLLEMSPMILEKKLRLSFHGDTGAPKPYADPQLLRQVILNLASNAAKYTPPGGEISIRICSDDGQIRWEIKDSGIGIPKIDQQKLFQKFYRAGNVLAVETEGTGLGLYFVRLIVERHGGRIWYESEEGAGSTFQFSIPVVSMPEQAETDSGAEEHLALHVA